MRSRYATNTAQLVKEAGLSDIVQSVVSSIGAEVNKISFRQKPFETIFRFMTPGILIARGSWMLAILMGVAEQLGFGPSKVGAIIDKLLGFGGTSTPKQVTSGGLLNAAKSTVDSIINKVRGKSSSFEQRITARGHMEMSDLLVAWAELDTMEKHAGILGRAATWLGLVKGQQRLSLIAVLYGVLKLFAKGLLLSAGIGFVVKKFLPSSGKATAPTTPGLFGLPSVKTKTKTSPVAPSAKTSWRRWRNRGGVQKSIIMALDNIIRDTKTGDRFSKMFYDARGRSLWNHPSMGPILADVRIAHSGAPLSEIDAYKTFVGPDPMNIARRLLPEKTYGAAARKTKPMKQIENEIGQILGGRRKI